MSRLDDLYRHSLALLTDLYQLTMACGYWKSGRAEQEAVFHLFFRSHPFGGDYTIACGLATAIEYLERLRFTDEDVDYLAGLRGADERAIFDCGFLDWLRDVRMEVDVAAVPEGTVVFPSEPLLRIRGPIALCQLVETPLLTILNFQTLIATKSARISRAAQGAPVLEFGLRRAQGIDGGLTASRAAWIGGCAATSNVLAGKLWDIPVRGTHAHSWIMSFDDELDAFRTWAREMPNSCVFLVDTYDTLEGVRKAIEVGRWLRANGHDLLGIRLDSGDLATLSVEARRLLDAAGFESAAILASNDLDEHSIARLAAEGAEIGVWGVGTRLATAWDQPALGGVYKLAAVRDAGAPWRYPVKRSEETIKATRAGIRQVHRYERDGAMLFDVIAAAGASPQRTGRFVELGAGAKRLPIQPHTSTRELLEPVLASGRRVAELPELTESRERAASELASFEAGRALRDGAPYLVGLSEELHRLEVELGAAATSQRPLRTR